MFQMARPKVVDSVQPIATTIDGMDGLACVTPLIKPMAATLDNSSAWVNLICLDAARDLPVHQNFIFQRPLFLSANDRTWPGTEIALSIATGCFLWLFSHYGNQPS
jgi:hypothetical protein